MDDCTLVIGLDAAHLRQLAGVWPTWQKNKPELMDLRMLFFHDESVAESDIHAVIGVQPSLNIVPWTPDYRGLGDPLEVNSQRHKMLAGFVFVPAVCCRTTYMLKLDTDVVAMPDAYRFNQWDMSSKPAIVGHKWGYTKPADQMLRLDGWVNDHWRQTWPLSSYSPLGLEPEPGDDRLWHPRIASYCALFHMNLVRMGATFADRTCKIPSTLPVPSQDGYLWYCATRMNYLEVRRVDMRLFGMVPVANDTKRAEAIKKAMKV